MRSPVVESDLEMLDCLRAMGPMTVGDLAHRFGVTPTAVRQRLNRLLAEGLIDREAFREGRGRPHYRYIITGKGRRTLGSNYSDLAVVLWKAIQTIENVHIRRQVLFHAAKEMARMYLPQIKGLTVSERMADVARILCQKRVPFSREIVRQEVSLQGASGREPDGKTSNRQSSEQTSVLVGQACPYPDLSESDPEICEFERLWIRELLGTEVELTRCRRDGGDQCWFQTACEGDTRDVCSDVPQETCTECLGLRYSEGLASEKGVKQ